MRIIILFALVALAGLSFSLQNVSTCQVINANDTYVLTANLVGSPISTSSFQTSFTCLEITVPNVILDCNGFSITENVSAPDIRSGIETAGPLNNSNITIRDCFVSGYDYDIALFSTNHTWVTNNTVMNSTFAGIYLSFGGNVVAPGSAFNDVTNNTAADNGGYGMATYFSDLNFFEDNVAYGSGNDGLRIENSNSVVALENVFFNNSDGIIVSGGNNNTIVDNEFSFNTRTGMETAGTTNSVVVSNYAHDIDGIGFFHFNGDYNATVVGNTVDNATTGFSIDGITYSVFVGNDVTNSGNGMFIRSDHNLFVGNSITGNNGFGIDLQGAENNTLIGDTVQENGFVDLSVTPYEDADCNNNVTGMIGSGGRPINYTNATSVISGGTFSELVLCNADNSVISNVIIDGSDTLGNNALWVQASDNVSITNTTSSDNQYGFLLEESSGTVLSGVTAMGNEAGLLEFTSSGSASTITSSVFSGNGWAIVQDSFNSVPFSVVNSLVGPVNISITDEIGSGGGGYSINETTSPGSAPAGLVPVGNRYLKILFTGDLGINSTTFHWSDADVSILDELTVRLYTWNNTGWIIAPSQTSNASSNSVTVLNLINITDDDIYGLFANLGSQSDGGDGGGDSGNPELSIIFESACEGNAVTVRGDGVAQSGASVEVNGSAIGTTDSSGTVEFEWDCSESISIEASKSGFEPANGTFSTVSCSACAAPECAVNADCASSEICSAAQTCEPLTCPAGQSAQDHQCVEATECDTDSDCGAGMMCSSGNCVEEPEQPECDSDSDCAGDEKCSAGSCIDVTGQCGFAENHAWVTYECGTDPSCPQCPSGQACESNSCVLYEIQCPASGFVGEEKTCKLLKDGEPCAQCAGTLTDPNGRSSPFTTAADGSFKFRLEDQGTYRVSMPREGTTVKSLSVSSLPSSGPGEETPPTAAGPDAITLLGLLLLVLLAVGAVLYWRSRK